MKNAVQIKEHMEVIGSDGQHVGTVDGLRDEKIILTKGDPVAGGQHHAIPMDWVDNIEQGAVRLTCTADQARQQWQITGTVERKAAG